MLRFQHLWKKEELCQEQAQVELLLILLEVIMLVLLLLLQMAMANLKIIVTDTWLGQLGGWQKFNITAVQ